MSRRRSKSLLSTLITLVILVAIIAGAVLLFLHYRADIEESFNSDFGVIYNDKTYRGLVNGISLPEKGQAIFSFKNAATCTVKVVPNYDFAYTIDGEAHTFYEHEDLTGIFVEQKNIFSDYFVINCTQDCFTVENVLKKLHGNDVEIVLVNFFKLYPFRIEVTSNTGNQIWLEFAQGEGYAHAVLSETQIIF